MTEELNNSANEIARPEEKAIDPLDAALSAAMEAYEKKEEPAPEPKEVKEEEAPEAELEKAEEVEQEEQEEEEEPKEVVKNTAPEHWPADDKKLFEKIKDPEARELALQIDKKLQAAHTRRSQELSEQVKVSETIKKSFEPYQEDLRRNGLNETTAVEALIRSYKQTNEFATRLQQNPKEVIAGLAKQYNVTLDGLSDEDDYKDPYVVKLEQEITQLKGEVSQVATSFQQTSQQENLRTIEAFKNATKEDGSLEHPHFERLRPAMANFVAQGADLRAAYDAALRADPELFKELLDREVNERMNKQKQEQLKKDSIEKAKKAKRSLSSHGSASKAPKPIKSIDDAFEAALEKHSGR